MPDMEKNMPVYAVRITDIPVVLIALAIDFVLFSGIFALWKSTGGISEGLFYVLCCGSVVLSVILAKLIWTAVRNSRGR